MAFALLIMSVVTAVSVCAQENYSAAGIRAYGSAVVVFARAHSCNGPPAVQLLASADSGKTWTKKGPALDGSEFTSSFVADDRLWIAGLHTAEGPGIDPFLLVPTAKPFDWRFRRIYEGPSDLEGVAMGSNGELSAWVTHIDMHTEDWTGPVYLHRSSDGGRTWNVIQQAPKFLSSSEEEFQEIQKQDGGWRVVELPDGGFAIQRQTAELGDWETLSQFHMLPCKQ